MLPVGPFNTVTADSQNRNEFGSGQAQMRVIIGKEGNDTINTGDGNDNISGKSGNDLIEAGEGDDLVSGGTGR